MSNCYNGYMVNNNNKLNPDPANLYPDPQPLLGKSNHNTVKVAIVGGIPLTCQNFLVDLFDIMGTKKKSLNFII